MTQLQTHESQGTENQEMESGQGSAAIEGTTDQPNVETQSESISINPSIDSEGTAHLGGADPRTLSNVLESQIERSESGSRSEMGSSASSRKRARQEQQATRSSTRKRKPPTYLNPIVTHAVFEENRAPSAELSTVMTAMQSQPNTSSLNQYNPSQVVTQFGQYYQGQQYYPAGSSMSNEPRMHYQFKQNDF